MSSAKASGRGNGKSAKVETTNAVKPTTKADTQKNTEKEKKQPSMEQVRLATLMDKEEPPEDLMEKVNNLKEITCKSEDEIMLALHDCEYNVVNAIAQLMDGKVTNEWSTTTKRKRKVPTNSKSEVVKDNGGDVDGMDTWEKNGPYSNASQYPNRGYRGNRRGGPRTPRDRSSFDNRRWQGRGSAENDGEDDKPRGRYRGDGRMTNGPSRGRGGRGGRGTFRMFQNRDRGGFPREIDTWNNPETPDNGIQRQADDFPSPEDWDNEEYTGSLADTKVFTPSTPVVEPSPIAAFETSTTDTKVVETQEIHTITIQNTAQGVTIPGMAMAGNSKQLTQAQSEYFNHLTQQSEQSRKQAALKPSPPLIYNSTVPTIQQAFGGVTISPGFASPTQSYSSAIATSPQYPTVTQSSFQSKSSIPYTNRQSTEYTSSNYNVGNYNSPLPPRAKPNASSSVDNDAGASQSATSDMNSAIKFLGAQFSAMEFSNTETYDPPEAKVDKTPPSLNNFSSSNVSRATTELPINYQSASASQPSPSIASVLSKAKLTNDSVLQGDNSIYSATSAVTSRGANMQDLKNAGDVSSLTFHGSLTDHVSASTYQPQSTSYPKPSTSYANQAVTTYSNSYATSSTLVTTSSSIYQPASTTSSSSVSFSFPAYPVTSPSIVGNSVYHNSSFPPSHGGVSNFQSYMSYPASVMQSYQGVATGVAQNPYTGTQYGNGSLTSVGTVAYGAANGPYHNNYGIDNNIPSTTTSHKISSSSSALTNPTAKEAPQFPDSLDAVTTSSNATTSISGTSSSLVSGSTTSTATRVTYSTSYTTGNKTSGVVPSLPPGVAPLMGPQYIMSQSGMPIYPQAAFLNYDDLYGLQRMSHMHTGYVDINYPGAPQTNLPPPSTARDPFSTISDGRFSRPDNTTSPLPPTQQSLSQPNAAGPGHQQPMINPGLLQTYTAAYLYPYTQYSTPTIYPMAAPNPAGGHGSSGSATRQQPSNYGSNVGYNSQYDATGPSQNNVSDFVNNKGNSLSGSFGTTQGQNKGPGTSSNVPTQNSNSANSDIPVNIYGKSHVSLSKSYDKPPFHAGGPGSFNATGGGTGASGAMSNVASAVQGQSNGPYGPHMYVPSGNVQHHMHPPNPHHQDGNSTGDRSSANFFRTNYR